MFSVKQLTEVTFDRDSLCSFIEQNINEEHNQIEYIFKSYDGQAGHSYILIYFKNLDNANRVLKALQKKFQPIPEFGRIAPIIQCSTGLTEDEKLTYINYMNRENLLLTEIRNLLGVPKTHDNEFIMFYLGECDYNFDDNHYICNITITIKCNKLIF